MHMSCVMKLYEKFTIFPAKLNLLILFHRTTHEIPIFINNSIHSKNLNAKFLMPPPIYIPQQRIFTTIIILIIKIPIPLSYSIKNQYFLINPLVKILLFLLTLIPCLNSFQYFLGLRMYFLNFFFNILLNPINFTLIRIRYLIKRQYILSYLLYP